MKTSRMHLKKRGCSDGMLRSQSIDFQLLKWLCFFVPKAGHHAAERGENYGSFESSDLNLEE